MQNRIVKIYVHNIYLYSRYIPEKLFYATIFAHTIKGKALLKEFHALIKVNDMGEYIAEFEQPELELENNKVIFNPLRLCASA